jgi:hypothetical protein
MNIRQKDEQRLAFLHRLYEHVGASTSRMIQQSEIGGALGFDDDSTDEIVDYLADQFLVERRAFGGMIGITADGVDEVEEALRGPREGTQHFPFGVINNVLIAKQIEGSQILIGTSQSTQTTETVDLETVRELVRELRTAIAELVEEETKRDVTADLDALQSQLGQVGAEAASNPRALDIGSAHARGCWRRRPSRARRQDRRSRRKDRPRDSPRGRSRAVRAATAAGRRRDFHRRLRRCLA